MKPEYIEFKNLLTKYKNQTTKPTLLLHSCCGPCSTSCLDILKDAFDITIYYYNPNIYPSEEFEKRLMVQIDLIKKMNLDVKIIIDRDDYSEYLKYVGDYINEKEGSIRCYKCYEFRLKRLAEKAWENKFDYYTTVMSVSPYKNSEYINEILLKYQKDDQTLPLYSDFKKEDGYKKSIKLSLEYDLYRQDYCGCISSIKEHEARIQNKNNNTNINTNNNTNNNINNNKQI